MPRLEIPADDPRPHQHYPLYETAFHRFVVAVLRLAFRPLMHIEVRGLEHFPGSGPAVLVANHLTTLDIFPLQLALPRMLFYMGKAELFQNNLVHAAFRQLGAFPVYRGERDQWAMAHAARVLAAGQVLAMFPEGTRSHGRGLAVAKPGAARLALEMHCPLVVVSLDGSQRFFSDFPRRRQVRMTIAPPLMPLVHENPLALTDRMMFTMAANLPADLRGVYAEVPAGFGP